MNDSGKGDAPRPTPKSRPPFLYQIRDWADQEARVECFSGRDSTHVVHEGTIIGYTEAPTARIQKDDGQIVSWVIGLVRRAQSDIDALPEWERELLEQEAARQPAPRVFTADGPEPPGDVLQVSDRDGDTLTRAGNDGLWAGEGQWGKGNWGYPDVVKRWRDHTLTKYDPYTEVPS